jgi:8-oxo-dGTP pyrophosphatase MutT (NUDIX family)
VCSSIGHPEAVSRSESPDQALRRELHEELGVTLRTIRELGTVDHIWFWNGREIWERTWLFSASSSDDVRLTRGESPELVEANGQRFTTFWRPIEENAASRLPPLCPSRIQEFLK